jgi:UDP-N-acetylmuramate dehydrogenase
LELIKLFGGLIGDESRLLERESMKKHTTFHIGGEAELFIKALSAAEIVGVLKLCQSEGIERLVLGAGSNILVGDGGIDGVVLKVSESTVNVNGDVITAGAGAPLSAIAQKAFEAGLSGLEFAYGIPGALGGALFMNAGAYDGEIKDVVASVTVVRADDNFSIDIIGNEDMKFGYRTSAAQTERLTILAAELRLREGNKKDIGDKMARLNALRKQKQPLDLPSAGSAFKRPEGFFAGKLIADAGLAGFSVGGARVSEKHCGFVVNYDKASARDVRELMDRVKEIVFNKFGVELRPEIRFVGNF